MDRKYLAASVATALLIVLGIVYLMPQAQYGGQGSEEKAIALVKSQGAFSFMDSYKSITSLESFRNELKARILSEITNDSVLGRVYQSSGNETDDFLEGIVSSSRDLSFSSTRLPDGNFQVNVMFGDEGAGNYVVDAGANNIVSENLKIPSAVRNLDRQSILDYEFQYKFPMVASDLRGKVASSNPVFGRNEIVVFYMPGCPHCENARTFLSSVESKYDYQVSILEINIDEKSENLEFAKRCSEIFAKRRFDSVPFIIVNNRTMIGWSDASEALLESYLT